MVPMDDGDPLEDDIDPLEDDIDPLEDDNDPLEKAFNDFFSISAIRSIRKSASRKVTAITHTIVKQKFDYFKLYGEHLTTTDTDTAFHKVTGNGNKEMDSKLFKAFVKEVAPKYQKDHKDCATTDDAYHAISEEIIRVARINSALDTLTDIEETCRENDIRALLGGSKVHESVKRQFQRDVEWKLLSLLGDVGNMCSRMIGEPKHVAVFSCLGLPEGKTIEFFSLAIKDIVQDAIEGLSALKDTLEALMAENFGKQHLKTLRLFRKLAGFLYDKQAVDFLIEISASVTTGDPSEWRVRLAMLRFVQVAGEYFQRLLPSTLSLHSKLPELQKVLQDIRNLLSHLRRSQLEKAKDTSLSTNNCFTRLKENIKLLHETLKEILTMLTSRSKQSPNDLWLHLKRLPEEVKLDTPFNWEGFKSLEDLLRLPKRGQKPDPTSYQKEIEDLLPFPVGPLTSVGLNSYISERERFTKEISDKIRVLGNSGNPGVNEAAKQISAMSPVKTMTEKRCEELLCELMTYTTSLKGLKMEVKQTNGASDQNIDKKEKKKLEDKLQKLKEVFINEAMGVSSYHHSLIVAQQTPPDEIQKQRKALNERLEKISPWRGLVTLSEEYTKFVRKLEKAKVDVPEKCRHFSWLEEPASTIEKLFHKVHNTGIFSKADKDAFRRSRIQNVLEVMGVFQEMPGVQSHQNMLAAPVKNECTENVDYLYQLARFDRVKELKNNYRQNMPRTITTLWKEHFEKDETSLYAHQFLLAAIYDIAKEIKDYPELACMRATIKEVRNFFFHSNPFADKSLIVDPRLFREVNIFINDPSGELAKEISLSFVNMRIILEDSLQNDIQVVEKEAPTHANVPLGSFFHRLLCWLVNKWQMH